jgi:hypothetical protein
MRWDYRDSRVPPIKFQFLLRFKIVVLRVPWNANNTGGIGKPMSPGHTAPNPIEKKRERIKAALTGLGDLGASW